MMQLVIFMHLLKEKKAKSSAPLSSAEVASALRRSYTTYCQKLDSVAHWATFCYWQYGWTWIWRIWLQLLPFRVK